MLHEHPKNVARKKFSTSKNRINKGFQADFFWLTKYIKCIKNKARPKIKVIHMWINPFDGGELHSPHLSQKRSFRYRSRCFCSPVVAPHVEGYALPQTQSLAPPPKKSAINNVKNDLNDLQAIFKVFE